jgi:enoyl-CoA hydratase/carnithine racemase
MMFRSLRPKPTTAARASLAFPSGNRHGDLRLLCRLFSSSSGTGSKEKQDGPRVETSIDASTGICRVTLNRPKKMNALDMQMFEAIAQTASDLRSDRSIRAIILSGAGRAFSAGLDVKSLSNNPKQQMERLLERPSRYGPPGKEIGNLAQDVSILWREIPAPVIGVLHGTCFGGGLQIALGCDMRYSTPDCQLSIMEGKWGLVPDMGITILLRELIPIDKAKELTMTARIISGEEAAQIGLVTKCVEDPMAHAEQVAKEIAQKSPDAVASAKRLYQETWTAPEAECLEVETKLQRKLIASWNQIAASGRAFGWSVPYGKRKDE